MKCHYLMYCVLFLILFLCSHALSEIVVYADKAGPCFNASDATEALQAAIDSDANTVIIRNMGSPWIVRPITFSRDNIKLVFDPNVIVLAKRGEFKYITDSLFKGNRKKNIELEGNGATLRMWKSDYQDPSKYTRAEWRNVLAFFECENIKIKGLNIESSGGDGIYIGGQNDTKKPSKNIYISDVNCFNNHRQGISITCAENVLVENSSFSDTSGTGPSAGIDIEPDWPQAKLENIVFRNIEIANNAGAGIMIFPWAYRHFSDPITLTFENISIKGGQDAGILIGQAWDNVDGVAKFKNITIEDTDRMGLWFKCKSSNSFNTIFEKVILKNVANKPGDPNYYPDHPIVFTGEAQYGAGEGKYGLLNGKHGNVEFVDCKVYDDQDRAVIAYRTEVGYGEEGLYDIKGTLSVSNPKGVKIDVGARTLDINIVDVK